MTGGVTKTVLRRLMNSDWEEDLEAISFTGVRGVDGIKEACIKLGDREVKIAVEVMTSADMRQIKRAGI